MNTITLKTALLVKKSIYIDYNALTEEIGTNPKASKFKVGNRVRIQSTGQCFSNMVTAKFDQRNICD